MHGRIMKYTDLVEALGVSPNRASKLLQEHGTSPSLRYLSIQEIGWIVERGRNFSRPNFSALKPAEWEKILRAPWKDIRPFMAPRRLNDLKLYSARRPVIDIRSYLPAPFELDDPGPLPEDWKGPLPIVLLQDKQKRPKMVRREGDKVVTILGYRETIQLLKRGGSFRATLDQWERLIPGSTSYLRKCRDGLYETTMRISRLREKVRDE